LFNMKIKQNKLVAFMLALSMLFSLLPTEILATEGVIQPEGTTVAELETYTFDEQGDHICSEYSGAGTHTDECSQKTAEPTESVIKEPVEETEPVVGEAEPSVQEEQPAAEAQQEKLPEKNAIGEISNEPTFFESLEATTTLDELIGLLADTNNSTSFSVLTEEEISTIYAHAKSINNANEKLRHVSALLHKLTNAPAPDQVYFDLSAGSVEITATTFSGCVFYNGIKVAVTGKHSASTSYHIYQSNNGDVNQTYDGYGVPVYDRVTHNGKGWGSYITNNTDIAGIVSNWTTDVANVGRTSTENYITVKGNSTYDVTIDNIWTTYQNASTSRKVSGIGFDTTSGQLTVKLIGDNRLGAIFTATGHLFLENGGSASNAGTLTVASYDGSSNHYNAVIGGNDNTHSNSFITINSGIIYAGAQTSDNCSGIGGGGNGKGTVAINGGSVTSVVLSSGTAIGGGIGESSVGGDADVTISGGYVYAYNYGYVSNLSGKSRLITGAAIGGGSSCRENGNASTVINISGGYVYAQSLGGTAIGGGSSTMKSGGEATVNISGSAIVEAQSIGGVDASGEAIEPGVSIGGGTAGIGGKGNGGNITLTIYGGSLYTGSVGGGNCANTTGKIGSGTITITGGTIRGQFVLGAGSAKKNIFTMTRGTINNNLSPTINSTYSFEFVEELGGALYLEYGDATIKGGTIKNCSSDNGGAVYVVGGDFYMEGGTITNCTSENGGAVYINDGLFAMTGGKFYNNRSDNGGSVYVNGGSFELSNGEFYDNESDYGGAVYVNNGSFTIRGGEFRTNTATDGGAAYISGGSVDIYNGTFDNNDAVKNGGAIYVNTNSVDVHINVFDGVITNNTSGNHAGAIGANASGNYAVTLNIGLESCKGSNCNEHDDGTCPIINNNTASRLGGAFCLHGEAQKLFVNIYCGNVKDNIAIRNSGSNTLNQGGGHVIVWGGDIAPGIMVGGGIYDDNRVKEDQIYIRFWANYDGGPADPVIVEVTYGITMVFPVDTYEWTGHELSGWSTSPDTTGLYVPANGQYSISYTNDGYLDFYAAWDAVTSYIAYIPDTLPIEQETKTGDMDISAQLNYFKANSTLNIYVNSDFALTNASNTHSILYQITSNEFGDYNIIENGGLVATFQYNNLLNKKLTAKIRRDSPIKYSDSYSGTMTFTVEYDETKDE